MPSLSVASSRTDPWLSAGEAPGRRFGFSGDGFAHGAAPTTPGWDAGRYHTGVELLRGAAFDYRLSSSVRLLSAAPGVCWPKSRAGEFTWWPTIENSGDPDGRKSVSDSVPSAFS